MNIPGIKRSSLSLSLPYLLSRSFSLTSPLTSKMQRASLFPLPLSCCSCTALPVVCRRAVCRQKFAIPFPVSISVSVSASVPFPLPIPIRSLWSPFCFICRRRTCFAAAEVEHKKRAERCKIKMVTSQKRFGLFCWPCGQVKGQLPTGSPRERLALPISSAIPLPLPRPILHSHLPLSFPITIAAKLLDDDKV